MRDGLADHGANVTWTKRGKSMQGPALQAGPEAVQHLPEQVPAVFIAIYAIGVRFTPNGVHCRGLGAAGGPGCVSTCIGCRVFPVGLPVIRSPNPILSF